ncbi:MAG TPA: GWxTD domain-containing protein, partial [Bacteroidota bacterium]|nr:GWxTD domain-containing protein [Bacteroidota bacterium]
LELTEQDADRKPLGGRWEQGIFSLTVPRGTYRVLMTAEDEESRRNILDSSTFVRTSPRAGLATASIVQVVPPAPPQGMPADLELVNYGGNILFGRPASLLVTWNGLPAGDTLLSVRYAFAEEPPAEIDLPHLPPDGEVTVPVYRGVRFVPFSDSTHAGYALARDNARNACAAVVPVPLARLLLRSFRMSFTLRAGRDSSTIVARGRAVWPDMPFTLKDIDNALDALRYITTEAALDSLRKGNLETRRANLEGFWRTRGGSTTSAFNEVMTEYYRRADHATRNFGTLRQPDGFRSDRGRIYVLHGPPTSTDRTLDPVSGFQEVWTYSGIRKKFIFIDQNRSGNYVLVSTTAL